MIESKNSSYGTGKSIIYSFSLAIIILALISAHNPSILHFLLIISWLSDKMPSSIWLVIYINF